MLDENEALGVQLRRLHAPQDCIKRNMLSAKAMVCGLELVDRNHERKIQFLYVDKPVMHSRCTDSNLLAS